MDFEEILAKHSVISYEPLLKGWSRDRKFILKTADGTRYLLRLSDDELFEKKKRQFELLTQIERLDLLCSRPVDFGVLDDGTVFTVLSFLDGVDGEIAVSSMSDKDAYRLGIEAGKVLRKLHGIDIPAQEKTWWERYLIKMPKKIAALEGCGLRIPLQEKIVGYYRENHEIMRDRPVVFCHGDYHLGNMIVNGGKIGVIDFDKNGVADPYDDLKPFCWNVMVNEYFETGLINGFFDGSAPGDFWAILKFYTAESLISHLPWSLAFGKEQIEIAKNVAELQMKWYGDFELDVPTWYKGSI